MLQIVVESGELWNEATEEFVPIKRCVLQLEHSLLSLSKWESKWCVPFLSRKERTEEEIIDYVRCMTITQNVDPSIYYFLSDENIRKIRDYIDAPMTATVCPKEKNNQMSPEEITAELIYYWMVALNIPFECQKWHLNRLLTLIKVCNIKSQPAKKHSRNEIIQRNRALNEARKKAKNTRG